MAIQAKYSRYYTYIQPVIGNKYVKSVAPYVFSLISVTIFTLFAIKPTVFTILTLQKEVENHRQVLQGLTAKQAMLIEGRTNLNALGEETIIKIENALPNNPDIPNLIKAVKSITPVTATASSLQIQPITIFETTGNDHTTTVGEVNFSYNIQGNYQELMALLSDIQKSPRIISLDNVTLSEREGGRLTLTLVGKAYYLK